jgi:ELWxxDGT repeat protein
VGGIFCNIDAAEIAGDCSETLDEGSRIILRAMPDLGSIFGGWAGCDIIVARLCVLTLDTDETVSATFDDIEASENMAAVLVKDIRPGNLGIQMKELTAVGDLLFFITDDQQPDPNDFGEELWRSDGTEAGTFMAKDIRVGPVDSGIKNLIAVGNTLFLSAVDGNVAEGGHLQELWNSDGTEAGTVLVKDINPTGFGNPNHMIELNGILYFQANDGTNGSELWRSDGTEGGTTIVVNLASGSNNAAPTDMVIVGETLFFSATNITNGRELWKTDGTAVGTVMVKDINPGGPPVRKR